MRITSAAATARRIADNRRAASVDGMLDGRIVVLLLVTEVSSVIRAHLVLSPSAPSNDCGQQQTVTPPPPSDARPLQHLLISFLPALTENKGRSKHFVGAVECALEVSSNHRCLNSINNDNNNKMTTSNAP